MVDDIVEDDGVDGWRGGVDDVDDREDCLVKSSWCARERSSYYVSPPDPSQAWVAWALDPLIQFGVVCISLLM